MRRFVAEFQRGVILSGPAHVAIVFDYKVHTSHEVHNCRDGERRL